jgi:hypothetical protein
VFGLSLFKSGSKTDFEQEIAKISEEEGLRGNLEPFCQRSGLRLALDSGAGKV